MNETEQDRTLRPWRLVTDEFNRRNGKTLTRARICQIARGAMEKIGRRLRAIQRSEQCGTDATPERSPGRPA